VLGAVSAPLSDFGIDSNEFTLAPRRGIRLGSATMCTPRSAVT
jgi:hypothetical protein